MYSANGDYRFIENFTTSIEKHININKNLILTASFGKKRDLLKYNIESMNKYAKKTNSDLIVLDDNHPVLNSYQFQDILKKVKIGRGNNKSYFCKIYFIYYYLNDYEKILWLDDTCYIRENCEDLFKLTSENSIGAYPEGKNKKLKSWENDQKVILKEKKFKIDRNKYINSGIVVYTSIFRDILSPINILNNKNLITSKYPHQCILNYLIQKNNIKLVEFDEDYNKMFLGFEYNSKFKNIKPDQIDETFLIKDTNKIIHITGFYLNREEIIKFISEFYQKQEKDKDNLPIQTC